MKTPTISFPKNIYHHCQRNFVDKDLLNVPFKTGERRLGALPYDWLKNRTSKEYAQMTEKVDELFRGFAVIRTPLSDTDECIGLYDEEFNPVVKYYESVYKNFKFVEKLSKILKRDDIQIEYVNHGAYKHCHKLTVGKFKYALLSFIRGNLPEQLEFDTLLGNGALIEPCNIFDFYKEYSQGRIVKPFMTRFVNDTNAETFDAYMLVKYIDENDTSNVKCDLPAYQKQFYKYKMTDTNTGNIINGIITDIGKIEKNDYILESSELRQDLFAFYSLLVRNAYENLDVPVLQKKYNPDTASQTEKAIHNAEEFVHNLMKDGYDNGYDIYNIDIRPFIKDLPELEQKFVIKKIRALKKVHQLKLKFQQNDEYKHFYEAYLENYAETYCSKTMKRELFFV